MMPQNKSILFSTKQQQQAAIAHALCHPARIKIIQLLKDDSFLLCQELTAIIPLAQPTISHHLNCLLGVKIIKRTVELGIVGYCINAEGWNAAKTILQQFFKETA